jgi:2-polyprenyl-3-methyl-5-hydroxy-6-metoxy-1,4-benzoquinol methylase
MSVHNLGMDEYAALNRANWDERVPAHARSVDYGLDRFTNDPAHLSDVVAFDRERLADISGLRGLHLQCHIGTDTLSLHRLGARMTGLDFSEPALEVARGLAAASGAEIDYVRADAYDAAQALGAGQFDLVYTGIGAICWLSDIARWGRLIAELLRPGGRLFIRDGHPALWAIDERREDHLLVAGYPYFETSAPLIWDEDGTYVDTDAEFVHTRTASWNHSIGELLSAVLDAGLRITQFVEHRSVPWEALPGAMTKDAPFDEWRLTEAPDRLPLTYTLQAVKDPER